jgi:phytoene synthase
MTPGSRLDPDRILALSYVPAARRPSLAALWELDALLAEVALGGREPMIARIKLAWWRDALEALDTAPPPAEPLLQSAAAQILPAGVRGAELARVAESWEAHDDPEVGASARGALLFTLSARLLGNLQFEGVEEAGQLWALADLARRRGKAFPAPPQREWGRWPAPLRPLGMLARLAERDAARPEPERQGSPGRMLQMLRHRLTGR